MSTYVKKIGLIAIIYRRYPHIELKYGEKGFDPAQLLTAIIEDDFALGMDAWRLVLRSLDRKTLTVERDALTENMLDAFSDELMPRLLGVLDSDEVFSRNLFLGSLSDRSARKVAIWCGTQRRLPLLFKLYDIRRSIGWDHRPHKLLKAAIVNCGDQFEDKDFSEIYRRILAMSDVFRRNLLLKRLVKHCPQPTGMPERRPYMGIAVAGTDYCEQEAVAEINVGETLVLVREPDNAHDAQAVAVCDGKMRKVGYIPRSRNMELAGAMDEGERYSARVTRTDFGARMPIIEIDILDS